MKYLINISVVGNETSEDNWITSNKLTEYYRGSQNNEEYVNNRRKIAQFLRTQEAVGNVFMFHDKYSQIDIPH